MSRIDELIAEQCPRGVEYLPLGELGRWTGGGTPSKSRRDFWDDGTIPWLSPKDMHHPIIRDTEDHITPAAASGSTTNIVGRGAIAVVVRSSILDKRFPSALLECDMAINQDMKALTTNDLALP